jgi:multidrug efflux pump subunit AcrA (membrane-fusion protein)
MSGRSKLLSYGLPVLAAIGLGTATVSILRNTPERRLTEVANLPPTQPADKDGGKTAHPAKLWIGAVGVIESASEEIAIGTRLSGVVDAVMVTAGAKVAKGDPLFRIDDRDYRVAVAQAEASLAVAKADLPANQKSIEQQRSVAEQVRAELDVFQAEVERAEKDRDRAVALIGKGNVTRQRLDTSVADALKAVGNLKAGRVAAIAADRQIAVLEAQTGQALARIAQAEAQLRKASLDLENATVRAPIDGTVLQVKVRPGQTVEARILDNALMVMGDTRTLHVRADIDEVDIPRFQAGCPAVVSPRGGAYMQIPATFVRTEPLVIPKKSLTGASTERVDTRVLQVIYAITDDVAGLYPGQQVDLFIEAGTAARDADVTASSVAPSSAPAAN